MLEARIARLREAFLGKLDAVLITGEVSRRYFSGIDTSAGKILVCASSAYFFADFRYYERVKKSVPHILAVSDKNDLGVTMKDILELEKVKTLGFEDRCVTVAELAKMEESLPEFSLLPIGAMAEKLREIKDGEERADIMTAQRAADEAFVNLLPFIKVGRTENELKDELERLMKKFGSEAPAFPTIVISGKKTAMPHGTPSDKKIEAGDFVVMDFGATKNGYKSDMTRTVAVSHATDRMRLVYDTVLGAQRLALCEMRAGMTGAEIDALARDYIKERGYGENFGHSLGHSVGLAIHENPNFSPANSEKIPEGAVITVEPGIYIEGEFGVRIEDMVVTDGEQCENLTASPKELLVL